MKKDVLTNAALLRRVISFAKPFKRPLLIVFSCIFAASVIDAMTNYCFSKIFDIAQKHGAEKSYMYIALYVIAGAAGLMFLRIGIVSIQMRTKIKELDLSVMNYLNHLSIQKFFSFSNGQHINEHSGVKQNIVNVGTNSIKNQMDLVFFTLFPLLTQLVVALGILFYSSMYVGLTFLLIGVLFCIMMGRLNKRIVPGVRKIRDRAQINSRFIAELYRFVVSVKIESQEENSLANLTDVQQKHKRISTETWIPVVGSLFKIRSMTIAIRFIALALIVYLVFNKQFTLGAMFLVFTYSTQFLNGLWSFMDIHKQFLIDKINIERYFEMLEVKSDVAIESNPIKLEKLHGTIQFKNVSFYYPQRVSTYEETQEETVQDHAVLKSVSFTIYSGEKVGIIGESGSGKSTLASLIRRSFDPQEGQILIDGNDLRLLDLKLYLEQVGNVEQEVVLFDCSIKDNILFGVSDKTKEIADENLAQIAKIARIDAFFPKLEHGFNTVVGEKGVKLSGGERQRVGIARALAKKPSLLIFDEATSALDALSERIVQESIDEACKGKTSIVIAHRLSTVKNCDRILVFRHGILLSEGTHDELLNTCEYYAELVHHQMITA